MKHKIVRILSLILIMCICTSCWDKVEIDERAFVFVISADKGEAAEEVPKGDIKGFYEGEKGDLSVNFTIVVPSKVQEAEKAFVNVKAEGRNIPAAIREVGRKLNRTLFFGHTRVFIFTEEITKDERLMNEILDFLNRDATINREMKVVFTSEPIKDITSINPKLENLLANYINGILDRGSKEFSVVTMDLNQFLSTMRETERGILPVIKLNDEDIEVEDVALIKDYKLLKILPNKYVRGAQIITNRLKKARKIVAFEGKYIPYHIYSTDTKIRLVDPENLTYKVEVKMEGELEDYVLDKSTFKDETINKIRGNLEKSFKLELEETSSYFQKEVGYDYLKIGDYTKKNYNNVYKKYEKNWDEAFRKAKIEYDVTAYIRRVGISK